MRTIKLQNIFNPDFFFGEKSWPNIWDRGSRVGIHINLVKPKINCTTILLQIPKYNPEYEVFYILFKKIWGRGSKSPFYFFFNI
jgi:cAMP phosphodiesterase